MTYEPGTTYGLGGWRPNQPGENILEVVTDNDDGTGERTTYAVDGSVIATEVVEVPYKPEWVQATNEDRIAELEATVAELLEIIEGG
jgi:hypothetical protein